MKQNDLVPAPNSLDGSAHHNESFTYFDHEYGGFSKPLGKESKILMPGSHSIKIVVQDVTDPIVDSAMFIPTDGIQFYFYAKADFNRNGVVGIEDYVIWRDHFFIPNQPGTFTEGDASGNGLVGAEDYDIWRANFGLTGFAEYSADFNRSGTVDAADYVVWRDHNPTPNCADRFDGDADGDADVDNDDYLIWRSQFGFGQQMMAGGGGGEVEAMGVEPPEGGWPTEEEMGITDQIKASARKAGETLDYVIKATFLPLTADADKDGDFDEDDLKIFDKLIPRN